MDRPDEVAAGAERAARVVRADPTTVDNDSSRTEKPIFDHAIIGGILLRINSPPSAHLSLLPNCLQAVFNSRPLPEAFKAYNNHHFLEIFVMAPLSRLRQRFQRMAIGRTREPRPQDEASSTVTSSPQDETLSTVNSSSQDEALSTIAASPRGRILKDSELKQLWEDDEFSDPKTLREVSHLMFQRFVSGGTHADLMASYLAVQRASQRLDSIGSSETEIKFKVLLELADRVNCVYEQTASEQLIVQALVIATSVVLMAPEDDPRKRAVALDVRAATYELIYHHHSSLPDLERSVRDSKEAWNLIASSWPPDLFHIPMNVANRLESRFVQTKQNSDIDRAIDLMREANEASRALLRPELTRAGVAHNLAIKLHLRWREAEKMDRENDLAESLRWYQEAVDLTPPYHPSKYLRLLNLTKCCVEKAKRGDKWESGNDIYVAINAYEEVLRLLPPKDAIRKRIFSDIVSLNEIIWDRCPEPDRKLQGMNDAIRWQEELIVINARWVKENKTEEMEYVESIIKLHNLYGRKSIETKDEGADLRMGSLRDEIKKYITLQEVGEDEEKQDCNHTSSPVDKLEQSQPSSPRNSLISTNKLPVLENSHRHKASIQEALEDPEDPGSSARAEVQARLDKQQAELTAMVNAEDPKTIYISRGTFASEPSSAEVEIENSQSQYKTVITESISTFWHLYASTKFGKGTAQAASSHNEESLRRHMVHAMEQYAAKLDPAYNHDAQDVMVWRRNLLAAFHGWLSRFFEEGHQDTQGQWEALLIWLRESTCGPTRCGDMLGMLALTVSGLWNISRNDSMLELTVPVHQEALRWLEDDHPLPATPATSRSE